MKFIKQIRYDQDSVQFMDRTKKSDNFKILCGALVLLAAGGGAIALSAVLGGGNLAYILPGLLLGGLFVLIGAAGIALYVARVKFPFNVVVDCEHLFVRKGRGYMKFHKFELGSVVYRTAKGESGGNGSGTDNFEIGPDSVLFQNDIKPIKRYVQNGQKLAYILIQTAQNTHSGVDWGVAYDSLPEGRRSPDSF